jgi:hypothetical protein
MVGADAVRTRVRVHRRVVSVDDCRLRWLLCGCQSYSQYPSMSARYS